MNKLLLASFFAFFCIGAQAQEQSLWKNDVYSGINGVSLDPTHALVSPNTWDVNLVGVSAFVQNNYAYLPDQAMINIHKNDSLETMYSNENSYFIGTNVDVLGPSFSFKKDINDREFAFGFFTRARSMVSGYNIDKGFNYNNFEEENFDEAFQIGKGKVTGMNWAEIGVNAATRINDDPNEPIQIGVNIKYLMGFDAAYVDNRSPLKAIVTKDSVMLSDYDVQAAISSAYDFDRKKYVVKPQGHGIGTDIGVSFVKNKYQQRTTKEYLYDYKINASLLDVGFIKFNGEKHSFKGNNLVDILSSEYEDIEDPYEFLEYLSSKVYGDSTASKVANNFVIGLPTSLSLGYQKSLSEKDFISVQLIQRIPVYKYSLKRANSISVGYRSNKEWLGYGASLSMYEYKIPQFGGYVRVGPLYLGSDNLLPIFFKQNRLRSTDVYLGLKLYPFWDSESKKRNREKCFKS